MNKGRVSHAVAVVVVSASSSSVTRYYAENEKWGIQFRDVEMKKGGSITQKKGKREED